MTAFYRLLPSVDEVLRRPELKELLDEEGLGAVTDATRETLAQLREDIAAGRLSCEEPVRNAVAELPRAIACRLAERDQPSLRFVINATGVILHTNLGRAPLGES